MATDQGGKQELASPALAILDRAHVIGRSGVVCLCDGELDANGHHKPGHMLIRLGSHSQDFAEAIASALSGRPKLVAALESGCIGCAGDWPLVERSYNHAIPGEPYRTMSCGNNATQRAALAEARGQVGGAS